MRANSIEATVDALLTVLDEDIQYVERSLSQLDALRSLLIKRDDRALEQLLKELQVLAEIRATNDRKRQFLREELAVALQCDAKDLTLTELQAELDDLQAEAVASRQQQLKSLVMDLKREHRLTAMLISDCSRFNQSLMRIFFGSRGSGTTTYGATGRASHQSNVGLMNVQL